MLPAQLRFVRRYNKFEGRGGTSAMTLVDVMIALAVLLISVTTCLTAFIQMNRAAFAARLQTTAVALAQQKIDDILSAPWTVNGKPPVLAPPTDADTARPGRTAREANLPLNNDASLTAAGLGSEFTSLDREVAATRDTTIEDVSAHQVRATVEVNYSCWGRAYRVALTTLRS